MFESLERIAGRRGASQLEEVDTRAFTQMWLRTRLKTEAIYCLGARGGMVAVAAASPAVRQAIRLLEFDLGSALRANVAFKLKSLSVNR